MSEEGEELLPALKTLAADARGIAQAMETLCARLELVDRGHMQSVHAFGSKGLRTFSALSVEELREVKMSGEQILEAFYAFGAMGDRMNDGLAKFVEAAKFMSTTSVFNNGLLEEREALGSATARGNIQAETGEMPESLERLQEAREGRQTRRWQCDGCGRRFRFRETRECSECGRPSSIR